MKSLRSYDPSKVNLEKTHVFMDEVDEKDFKRYATLLSKSLWVAVSFDSGIATFEFTSAFKDANRAMHHFKSLYPEWYIPFFNYILRTTQNIAEELKNANRSTYQMTINNESKLNNVLDVPQNIQEGPEPVIFEDLPSDHFCEQVLANFKETGKNDMALVVICIYDHPVKSMSSKAIKEYKTEFANYSDIFEKYPAYGCTLAFLLKSISAAGREPPLFWINDCSFSSNEDEIKNWIRGKSKCDLIADFYLMPGFEASTLFSFSSDSSFSALSRTRVKHIHFKGKYENMKMNYLC